MATISLLSLVAFLSAFPTFVVRDCFGDGGNGLAWGDLDNDGVWDLAKASRQPGGNYVYRNDGAGGFVVMDSFPCPSGLSCGASWGDFDNDGHCDLVAANSDNMPNRLFMNEHGVLSCILEMGQSNTWGLVWADFDGDGDLDLAEGVRGEADHLWRNDGGLFVETDLPDMGDANGVSWGDCDNDGRPDLVEATRTRGIPDVLYRNKGGGVFERLAAFGTGGSQGCVLGDFNNDGSLDAVFTRDDSFFVWVNKGDGSFAKTFGDRLYAVQVAGADFDNDGNLDLVLAGWTVVRFYRGAGDGTFALGGEYVMPAAGRSISAVACADANDDGSVDVAAGQYYATASNKSLVSQLSGRDFVKVRVQGRGQAGFSNRTGIGAEIQLYDQTPKLTASREICAGHGGGNLHGRTRGSLRRAG